MRDAWSWVKRNDPLGATVKGIIVMILGVTFLLAGGVWLGIACVIVGIALLALPIRLYRRDQAREQAWRRRRYGR